MFRGFEFRAQGVAFRMLGCGCTFRDVGCSRKYGLLLGTGIERKRLLESYSIGFP